MTFALARASGLAVAMTLAPGRARGLQFSDLEGWAADDHQAALSVFLETSASLGGPDWALISRQTDARDFFERHFRPVLIGVPPAHFTGYFEPELRGALDRSEEFSNPIYRLPPGLVPGAAAPSREQIERLGVLEGRGLEIAFVDDPLDAFFLQVQGSGRIRMADGQVIRIGYAGQNGHPYRSIGKELVRRGASDANQISAQVIREWVRANPEEMAALLHHNPSYVFFRALPDLPAELGPIGTTGASVSALRSIAVDPVFTPLGAPVWVEKDGTNPMRRLMIAQDTGGAIKGAQRADIFYGTGKHAGEIAGRTNDGGRMVVLLPVARAEAILSEG